MRAVLLLTVVVALAGCTYERRHEVRVHYADFKTLAPRGNTVTVCHAYGCQAQTNFRFTQADIAKIREIFRTIMKADTPHEERRGVAYAIAWIETRVGKEVGTETNRPGMDFAGSGDPTQQDCVDEATNTTSYMLVMQHNGLLRHHTVGTPFSKGNILSGFQYWPHWTAVLTENATGQRYAVDSWIHGNGENPAIVKAEDWYIKDLNSLPDSLL